jgi:hypothetical protein
MNTTRSHLARDIAAASGVTAILLLSITPGAAAEDLEGPVQTAPSALTSAAQRAVTPVSSKLADILSEPAPGQGPRVVFVNREVPGPRVDVGDGRAEDLLQYGLGAAAGALIVAGSIVAVRSSGRRHLSQPA